MDGNEQVAESYPNETMSIFIVTILRTNAFLFYSLRTM